MNNWKSAVVSGTFHELSGAPAEKAREYLFKSVLTLMTGSAIHRHEHEETSESDDSNRLKPLIYQIEIKEKTGRFEKD